MIGAQLTFFVVTPLLDTFTAKLASQAVELTLIHVSPPLLDDPEHSHATVLGSIVTILAQSGMMEYSTDDTIHSPSDV